jgi:hypothetical protein
VEPAYWDSGADGQRWAFYRKRAEGHNTLVVDPDDGPDQDPLATCPIERVTSTEAAGVAVVDMTPAYPSAERLQRGVRLDEGRTRLLVRDEIEIAAGSGDGEGRADVWWFMHTKADVDVHGRTATLSRDGEELSATIATPGEATFEVRETAPLPSSHQPDVDEPIACVQTLAIHLPAVTETALAVQLGRTVDTDGAEIPLSEWASGDGD